MSGHLSLLATDITILAVNAIVNAANESLLPGGGMDGAICRVAGPRLTGGYQLPAAWVTHTVGPRWRDGKQGEPEALANCYRNSLVLAAENAIRSIAFPAISTGIYGFSAEQAAVIAVDELRVGLERHLTIEQVLMVSFGERDHAILSQALAVAERNGP